MLHRRWPNTPTGKGADSLSARPAADSASFLVANVVDFIHESASFRRLPRLPKKEKQVPQVQESMPSASVPQFVLRFGNNLSAFVTASRALFSFRATAAAKRSWGPISDYPPCSHALDALGARWHHACLQQTMVGCVNTLT